MLLYGISSAGSFEEATFAASKLGSQKRACSEIGKLMEALLSTIDANDVNKLKAGLRFFYSVFCSSVKLSEISCLELENNTEDCGMDADNGLPLGIDLRGWAVSLVESLFDAAASLSSDSQASANQDNAYVLCV